MDPQFEQVVTSEAELRALLGQPSERVLRKVRATLDDRARAYIGACPFIHSKLRDWKEAACAP